MTTPLSYEKDMKEMREKTFREKCAEIEYPNAHIRWQHDALILVNNPCNIILSAYDNDNDLDRVIRLLKDPYDLYSTYHKYIDELERILTEAWYRASVDETFLAADFIPLATPAQKKEALARALGCEVEG